MYLTILRGDPSPPLPLAFDSALAANVLLRKSDLTWSNVQEQVWTWVNDGDEYFYDKNEWVRVRVEDEQWIDISPSPPSERGDESTAERKSPYSITVSVFPLCKNNVLTKVGFNVAVRTWASRMVVGQRTCESRALSSRQNSQCHRIIDNQQSTQKEHLHNNDLKCTPFPGSIGRLRRTITL